MRARIVLIIILSFAFSSNVAAQRQAKEPPKSFTNKVAHIVQVKVLPGIDAQRLRAQEDARRVKDRRAPGPLRFAVAVKTAYDARTTGTWTPLPDGRLWRLQIQSPGALSHNVGFTRFDLPEGARLWLYDSERRHVQGPFTAKDRSRAGTFWSPIIPGEQLVMELFLPGEHEVRRVPAGSEDRAELRLVGPTVGIVLGAADVGEEVPVGDDRVRVHAVDPAVIRRQKIRLLAERHVVQERPVQTLVPLTV